MSSSSAAGSAACRRRGRCAAPVRVTLIDRANHHLFQPLLYQVATAMLAPAEIASPIRGPAQAAQRARRCSPRSRRSTPTAPRASARRQTAALAYDYLVLATGATHSYFGHDEYARIAPGLKSLADATVIRASSSRRFEIAELEPDPARHRELLTFVLVGAGPTGVEMAGAIAEMTRGTLGSDFRRIDPGSARIVLIEAGPRILSASPSRSGGGRTTSLHGWVSRSRPECASSTSTATAWSRRAAHREPVVFWTAGVAPSPAGKWLGARRDHAVACVSART